MLRLARPSRSRLPSLHQGPVFGVAVAMDCTSHLQEADFNLGRAYHQLGLVHLAVPYYEKALSAGFREPLATSRTRDGRGGTEQGPGRGDTRGEMEGDVQEGVCARLCGALLKNEVRGCQFFWYFLQVLSFDDSFLQSPLASL